VANAGRTIQPSDGIDLDVYEEIAAPALAGGRRDVVNNAAYQNGGGLDLDVYEEIAASAPTSTISNSERTYQNGGTDLDVYEEMAAQAPSSRSGDHGHAYQTGGGGIDLDVYDVMPALHSTASKPAAVAAGAGAYMTLSGLDHLMYSGTDAVGGQPQPAAVAAGAGTYTTLSGSDHLMYSGAGAAEEVYDGFGGDGGGGVEL